jgi:hypothetical protein
VQAHTRAVERRAFSPRVARRRRSRQRLLRDGGDGGADGDGNRLANDESDTGDGGGVAVTGPLRRRISRRRRHRWPRARLPPRLGVLDETFHAAVAAEATLPVSSEASGGVEHVVRIHPHTDNVKKERKKE